MKFVTISLFCIIFGGILGKGEPVNPIFHEGEVANTIFQEIISEDGLEHWFLDLNEGTKYCWYHMEYENLKIVPKKLDTLTNRP